MYALCRLLYIIIGKSAGSFVLYIVITQYRYTLILYSYIRRHVCNV